MANPSDILQYRNLLDRLVLDRQTMAEVGRVDTLWMYPQRNRVLGVVCRPGRFGAKRLVFKLTQMTVAEENLVMQGDPEPTVAAKVQQLESLIGQEVWSDRGERVGKIVDCLFNPENGVILRYLLVSSPWASLTEGTYLLSPKQIISFSAKRTLVSADVAAALEVYEPGLRQRLAQIREMLKEEYVGSVARELQSLSSQVQSQFQTIAQKAQGQMEQAQEQMETLLQRTRERAKTFSEEFSQEAQGVVHQIQTEAQAVTQRVEQASERFGVQGGEAGDLREKTIDIDEDDWGVWPDSDGDGAERRRAETQTHQPQNSPAGDSPQQVDADEERPEPIIVPAAADHLEPSPDHPSDGVSGDSGTAGKASEEEQGASGSLEGAIAADDVFEGWPIETSSGSLEPESLEPESLEPGLLEPDERDIWDDWEDDAAGTPAGAPAGEAGPGAGGNPPEDLKAQSEMPPAKPDEDDPWI